MVERGAQDARIEIRTLPSGDAEFRQHVLDVYESERPVGTRDLQAALRSRYPLVVVRAQHPLAAATPDAVTVWYAFRNGSVLGPRKADREPPVA